MNEARRQASLSAMGIQLWYARGPLPGAAASPAFDWVPTESVETPPQSTPGRDDDSGAARSESARADRRPRPSLASVRESLKEAPSGKTADRVKPEAEAGKRDASVTAPAAVASHSNKAVASEAPESPVAHGSAPGPQTLRLEGAFQAGQRLNLAMDLSQELSEAVQLSLAANILKALGEVPEERVQPLSWPVFANPSVPGNDDEGLLRLLPGLLDAYQGRPWLVLGEQMQSLFEALSGQSPTLAPVWLASSVSLQSLAADPANKAHLWHRLQQALSDQPLKAAVEAS